MRVISRKKYVQVAASTVLSALSMVRQAQAQMERVIRGAKFIAHTIAESEPHSCARCSGHGFVKLQKSCILVPDKKKKNKYPSRGKKVPHELHK